MRTIKSLLVVTAVVGLMTTMGARSFAAPLLPSFPSVWSPNQMIAGQSKLVNPGDINDYINVDWIVFYDADGIWGHPGSFVYMYQLENTAGSSAIRAFNVKYGGTGVSDEIGIKAGDLDVDTALWLGHNTTNFANLNEPPSPKETEPGGSPQGIPTNYNALRLLDSVSFTTIDIGITRESLVLYIIDPRPPMYGEAKAQDGTTWWGMVTLLDTTYGDPVPVPSPEPQVALLLLAGLTGMLVRLRMSKS